MRSAKFLGLLVIVFPFLVTSCKQDTNKDERLPADRIDLPKTDATRPDQALRDGWHCFEYTMDRDTYDIRLNINQQAVTGHMRFKNYQKDSSEGAITGTLVEDILNIYYNFESEGMSSVRQIMLKVRNNLVITGEAEEVHRGDSALIGNPDAVVYEGIIYSRVICGEEEVVE